MGLNLIFNLHIILYKRTYMKVNFQYAQKTIKGQLIFKT
ncbi:MAG: hypothetical protein Ct9H90mP20_4540 [Candidatus Neomarinimicrobiota bacterium]|nr:MAG: hypothetical protein Ct9H90mP20_4540 [Candidatus Neomarinimicrobiota bacterium]